MASSSEKSAKILEKICVRFLPFAFSPSINITHSHNAIADVWTVNKRSEMIEATKWGAKAILTDKTAEFLALRAQMEGRLFPHDDLSPVCKSFHGGD